MSLHEMINAHPSGTVIGYDGERMEMTAEAAPETPIGILSKRGIELGEIGIAATQRGDVAALTEVLAELGALSVRVAAALAEVPTLRVSQEVDVYGVTEGGQRDHLGSCVQPLTSSASESAPPSSGRSDEDGGPSTWEELVERVETGESPFAADHPEGKEG